MPESLPSPVPSDAESARFRILEPLRAAQEQLARVQDAAGIGVFTLDLREGVLHPSPAFCRLHGLEVRERYALAALAERFPAEDTAIPSGTSSEEAIYRVRDSRTGASRWIARTLEIERDADGAALRLAGVVRDVTEQRAQGTALAESEQHYRTLFEQMDEGYSVIEFIDGPHGPLSDYVHVTANRAYAQHAGIENVAGKRLREIVGEEAEGWLALYGDVLRTGRPIRFQRELVATGRYLELAAFRIEPPSRRQVAVLFQDITARRRVEHLLHSKAADLEAEVVAQRRDRDRVWTLSPVLKVVATPDGRIEAVNPSWGRTLGWSPAETVGRYVPDFFAPEERATAEAALERLAAGASTDLELTCLTKDGGTCRVLWTIVPADGLLYGFGRDITEQRHAEEALRQSQKLEAVGQLTGGVAHDFNNLLNVVLLNLDRVERGLPEASPLRTRLRDAVKGAERAATMTHKLLAFARRQPLSPVSTDVNAQIASFAEFLRGTIGPRIRLETDLAPNLPRVRIDPNQFESAILNLAVNARDAMPEGGTLTLATRPLPEGDGFAVEVSDTGAGMAPEVEARAFEPFFTTKPLGQGTGLGLSQVFGFAQQSGGSAAFVRDGRPGTTVRLSFPAQAPAVSRPAVRQAPVAEPGFAPLLPPVAVAG